jgi:hypothetical protein
MYYCAHTQWSHTSLREGVGSFQAVEAGVGAPQCTLSSPTHGLDLNCHLTLLLLGIPGPTSCLTNGRRLYTQAVLSHTALPLSLWPLYKCPCLSDDSVPTG